MKAFIDSAPAEGLEGARERVRANLAAVSSVLAIASIKGGSGKSTLAVNFAVALAMAGRKVAIADTDLNSPSVLAMLGMKQPRSLPMVEGIEPASGPLGVRVVSSAMIPGGESAPINLLDDEQSEFENRAPRAASLGFRDTIVRMLSQSRIGAVETLIVDLAPGLDRAMMLSELIPSAAMILVSNPSSHGANAARHGLEVAQALAIPVVGIVENMAGFHCDSCRTVRPLWPEGAMQAVARGATSRVLGRLPFEPRVAECGDRGEVFVRAHADTPTARAMAEIFAQIESALGATARSGVNG